MRWYLLFLFGQVWCVSIIARPETDTLRWRYLTVEDGLLNYYVTAIHQDKLGFLWIGSKGGLNRYDGYEFEAFVHTPSDSTSLSNNDVSAILEDSYGQLWIGTNYGLNLLQKNRSGFTRFLHNNKDTSGLAGNSITTLFEDSHQNLWIASQEALHLYHRKEATFSHFLLPGYRSLKAITEDRYGRLVLGFTEGGVIHFDKEKKVFLPGLISEITAGLPISSLLEDEDGTLWIGTNNGLYALPHNGDQLIDFPIESDSPGNLNSNLIFDLFEADNGSIWVSTDGGGVNVFNKTHQSFSHLGVGVRGKGLNSMAPTRIFQDRSGGLWVGTVNGGINQLKKYQNKIDHYTYDNGNFSGLSSKSVLSLFESEDGNIWIGLDQGGLNYFDRQTQRFTHYLHDPNNANSLIGNVINDIYEDSRGDLYLGTYLNSFDILDREQQHFKHHWKGKDPKSDRPAYIRMFLEDSYGNFWIASTTHNGLYLYDRDSGESTEYGASIGTITYLFEDRSANLWVGTSNGLHLLDRDKKAFQSWQHTPADPNSINSNLIITIYEDDLGKIWIGTDKGLNRFDREQDRFVHYTTANGLPGNWVKRILPGHDQHLWISTNRGICRFSSADGTGELLDLGEDIKSQEFGGGAVKTKDGKLWFGSVNGMYSFYPDKIRRNPVVPPVVLTRLLIANQEVKVSKKGAPLEKHLSETRELTLTHQQSAVFTFDFVALNYTLSSKNQYAYKLEGFEENWNYVGQQRNATYTNIDPGHYIFRVKASNNDGVWNEKGVAIKLIILAPWWKTGWAYGLYVVVFILAGLGIRYSEKNRMQLLHNWKMTQLEKEKAEEISRVKSRFFTNISHEFKTPLTLILGPLDRIIAAGGGNALMKKQFHMMHQNANRLLALIDQLMDFRKAEIGQLKLSASRSDLVAFVQEVVALFDSRGIDKQISLQFHSTEKQQHIWFDREKIDKVLFNLLSNAFKHTEAGGSITVTVTRNGEIQEYAEIIVEDTGCGIAAEDQEKVFDRFYQVGTNNNQGSGIGLSLSKTLVALHHGQIKLQSEVGKGSKFTIRLPIGKQHLSAEELAQQEQVLPSRLRQTVPLIPHTMPTAAKEVYATASDKTYTLLIVEDELEIRSFLREILESFYFIEEAADAQEGLHKAKKVNPDLIISDIMMPGMNGFEYCKQLKTNLSTSHIPVILLTARTGEESHLTGLDTGADDYLTKPFNARILLARIKNLIGSRVKLKDRFFSEFQMKANEITITSIDEQFIMQAVEIVEKNMAAQDFNVDHLVREMAMSRSVFSKKLKALSGQAPSEFIMTIKMKRAAALLLKSGKNISAVAYDLGFVTPKTFRTQFKKQYGQTPSEFIQIQQAVSQP